MPIKAGSQPVCSMGDLPFSAVLWVSSNQRQWGSSFQQEFKAPWRHHVRHCIILIRLVLPWYTSRDTCKENTFSSSGTQMKTMYDFREMVKRSTLNKSICIVIQYCAASEITKIKGGSRAEKIVFLKEWAWLCFGYLSSSSAQPYKLRKHKEILYRNLRKLVIFPL